MNTKRAIRVFITAAVTLLGVSAANCDIGEDSPPNAPQAPGPERGGPPPRQPGQPNPQADPEPDLEQLKREVRENPGHAIMYVIWENERRFYFEWTLEAGQVPQRITQRAQHRTGGYVLKVVKVRPGQTIGFTAGPTDMARQALGPAHCYIYHASGVNGFIGDFQGVPQGPCAVSYTIPA